MTLHWWQHWFWITGRAPVLALLLVFCSNVRCQQPSWLPGGPGRGPGGLEGLEGPGDPGGLGGTVLLHVPVEVHFPVAVAPWAAPWPWAPRRLLGFANPAQESPESGSTSMPVADTVGVANDPTVTFEASSTGTPVAVTYLTSLGPNHGLVHSRGDSTSQPRAREPKAIGVDPVAAPAAPAPTTPSRATPPPAQAVTATSVLEIIEEVVPTEPPYPVASASPSPPMEDAMESEMANDEPARTNVSSDATTLESTATPDSVSPGVSASASPAFSGPLSLSTGSPDLTAGTAAAAAAAGNGPSSSTTVVTASRVPGLGFSFSALNSTAPTTSQASLPAHPGLSTPRRFTPPAVTPTTLSPSNLTTTGASVTVTSPTAADEAHVHQSASTSLGSAPSAPASRQRRPGVAGAGHGVGSGPGAMSLSSGGGLDAGSITGIVLGIVVFAGLVGTVSFVLYRRRYLNKPQTLNDKCSNPDSSGYIDDSTLRENSEEMYSLDNDSFLNSLEAMTIQNYWTDTVKHTKL